MISVIICSVNKQELERVSLNISNSIGVAFEIVSIDNINNTYGICNAYNKGASLAKGDIFCFVHEDVAFETVNWGLLVQSHLAKENIGIIGVAGGSSKSLVPWSWSPVIYNSEINIVQHYKDVNTIAEKILKTNSPQDNSSIKNVVSLDGVWLCVRRDVFDQFQFDAKTFIGFHGYDMDLSMQIGSKYTVAVVFDIIINHFSVGRFNKDWIENTIKLSDKWKGYLPKSVYPLSEQELILQHWACMKLFIAKLLILKYNKLTSVHYLIKYSMNKYFKYNHFLSCLKLILIINK